MWRRPLNWIVGLVIAGGLTLSSAHAGPVTVAARESAEAIIRQFGKEAAGDGLEKLVVRLESLATRFGDDALSAARKVGPRGVAAIEAAGERGPLVAKLLNREGNGALWLVEDAARLQLVARCGDDAAEALLKHKSLAQPLIGQFDDAAVKALNQLDGQNVRRLAMMADQGELAQMGHTPELLNVVGRFGNRAMDFIWDNKGALAVTAAMTAFLADPEGFLNGTRQLAKVVGENVVVPASTAVAREIAPHVDWTLVTLGAAGILGIYALAKYYLRQRFSLRTR